MFNNIRYPVGKVFEDDFILHKLLWNVKRVACISYIGYNYVQRNTSITNTFTEPMLDEIESRLNRADFYRKQKAPVKVQYINFLRCYYFLYKIYEYADFKHEPFLSELKREYKILRINNRLIRREKLSLTQRIVMLLNYISPYYTWRMKRIFNRLHNTVCRCLKK